MSASRWRWLCLIALAAALPAAAEPAATPADKIDVPDGFEVELLYSVPTKKQGSWVAIAFAPDGRLYASSQYGRIYRLTGLTGGDEPAAVEPVSVKFDAAEQLRKKKGYQAQIGKAHGLEWAHDSLYVMVNGHAAKGSGLYRLRDTDGDGRLDDGKLLRRLLSRRPGAEHGPHSIVPGPDGESLYLVGGNMAGFPKGGPDESRLPRVWGEDQLLPRMPDARGHASWVKAPGGWVMRTGPDGKTWELIAAGFRNAYDIAFNGRGDLFAYDADMEWDMGTPWYRPTRICHAVSGAEFGWRNGTGKWPVEYPDSLPPAINMGAGSPTGMLNGRELRFPAEYQRALYAADWTFGTLYAVRLKAEGASYTGTKRPFLTGKPLPLTDLAAGPDGALYFTIGGRRIQSGLYRVRYVGDEPTGPVEPRPMPEEAKNLHALRDKLESFHGRRSPDAVETAWPHLSHGDRFIRYAARIAVEHQPVKQWRSRALAATEPWTVIHAMIALARHGEPADRPKMLKAMGRLTFSKLSEAQKLGLLRAYGLTFIRLGEPDAATKRRLSAKFNAHYPAETDALNRELSRMLVYLDSPKVVPKTVAMMSGAGEDGPDVDTDPEVLQRNREYGEAVRKMLENPPNTLQMHYVLVLRVAENGWTLPLRKRYFAWFNKARGMAGGKSFQGFVQNIKKAALKRVPEAQKEKLKPILEGEAPPASELAKVEPRATFINSYTIEKLMRITEDLNGSDYERGRKMFAAARCYQCHRVRGEGGGLGPDLTNVAHRFSRRDLIVATVRPNKTVTDQYQSHVVRLKDGGSLMGRIVGVSDGKLRVAANPTDPDQITAIDKDRVVSKEPAPISFMPPGLMNVLKPDEARDLIAFLLAGGDPEHKYFEGDSD